MNEEIIKQSLLALEYGKVASSAMVERGPYAEEKVEEVDATSSASTMNSNIFSQVAEQLKNDNEDLLVVRRKNEDTAVTQEDIDWFVSQLSAEKHLIFIECLMLGTSEIKAFINALLEHQLMSQTKLVLLDITRVEFLTLRDIYKDRLEFA